MPCMCKQTEYVGVFFTKVIFDHFIHQIRTMFKLLTVLFITKLYCFIKFPFFNYFIIFFRTVFTSK